MDASNWVSLSVGFGGLLLGALGMWLTYSSRTASLQQTLHSKQLDAGLEIMTATNTLALVLMRLHSYNEQNRERSEQQSSEADKAYEKLGILLLRYEVILPNSVIRSIHAFQEACSEARYASGDSERRRWENAYTTLEYEVRRMMGTDPLTHRTMLLMAKSETIDAGKL
jgi:hypothetical protein